MPDPDVAQQLADLLANEKKNQAPENWKKEVPLLAAQQIPRQTDHPHLLDKIAKMR
ncbi:hypothetical protein GR223_28725 [Rhizobium leguminosarum]|uniref:hypothetical protein n=1 Tax=Rhizobium ruizarguesonis TaxID=2081791 RepID=UPI0013DFA136|nr:hypothetical protein [Rhizobium ruizarguesonis]NEJ89881.1 hypothetical protein [Rhizobium ruizarguesonis]